MAGIEDIRERAARKIGKTVGVSDWIVIDQPMIDAFAEVTHDPQFIHTDPERAARETPFGGTIAHGFLTLSLASRFATEALEPMPGQTMGVNYGFDRVRFVSPVCCNDAVRGHFTFSDVVHKSGRQLLNTYGLKIEIRDKPTPAVVAEWLTLTVF